MDLSISPQYINELNKRGIGVWADFDPDLNTIRVKIMKDGVYFCRELALIWVNKDLVTKMESATKGGQGNRF